MSENEIVSRFRVGMKDWPFRIMVIFFVLGLAGLVEGWVLDSLPVIALNALSCGATGYIIGRAVHIMPSQRRELGRQQREVGQRNSWDEDPTCLCTAAERATSRCSVPCPPEWIR